MKALQLSKDLGINTEAEPTKFKASRGWMAKFLIRYNLVIRKRTHVASNTNVNEQEIQNFRDRIAELIKQHNYPFAAICNMDETPIFFE